MSVYKRKDEMPLSKMAEMKKNEVLMLSKTAGEMMLNNADKRSVKEVLNSIEEGAMEYNRLLSEENESKQYEDDVISKFKVYISVDNDEYDVSDSINEVQFSSSGDYITLLYNWNKLYEGRPLYHSLKMLSDNKVNVSIIIEYLDKDGEALYVDAFDNFIARNVERYPIYIDNGCDENDDYKIRMRGRVTFVEDGKEHKENEEKGLCSEETSIGSCI